MREKVIESSLRIEAKKRGGMALKFISPGMNGVPDRLVLMPNGRSAFVELKSSGEKPDAVQKKRMKQLSELGFAVYIIDSVEKIGVILDEIQST